MPLHNHREPSQDGRNSDQITLNPLFSGAGELRSIPRLHIPPSELAPDTAAQLIRDELLLDGSARLNLATFVTTWMEPQAAALMADCADKNMIDKDEYPQTAEFERRCINILADLWHADADGRATGCSTTGSSEAAMLAGLALLWRWRQRRSESGLEAGRPNLVMGINVQVCWEKFCRYWDVEPRYAPMEADRRHLTAESALPLVDENTIGVVAILGSTQDGSYEPVADICSALDGLSARGGPDVPVHVDAASGGFVAPFIQPELEWDFRLPRVSSINASGHKYGLVYPGVGWALWRDTAALPDGLVFHVNYLGGSMPTFALNFSRPGAQVVAQYYQLIRLGREGYRRVQQASQDVALYLSSEIGALGPYRCLTDGGELPVFVFRLESGEDRFTVFDVSDALRKRGWQVPAYSFPENLTDVSVLRIVVRNGFGRDLADMFLQDLADETRQLDALHHPLPQREARESFHH
jgi:glutamate decarboxylase